MGINYKIRFGYHKCLTKYMNSIFDDGKHFLDLDYRKFVEHIETETPTEFIAINNYLFKPDRKIFSDAKIVHLIRHPKDLIVSGYFYHKRGAEVWTQISMPYRLSCCYLRELRNILSEQEKEILRGLPSMQEMLNSLDLEKGMMLEIVWRKYEKDFNPVPYYKCSNIQTFRFENIMQDPYTAIEEMCAFWKLDDEKTAYYLERLTDVHKQPSSHIRDSSSYQYKEHFNINLDAFFENAFHGMQLDLGYPE